MRTAERGVSAVGIIVTLVVAAALVVGGLYFFTDVFHSKIKGAWKNFAEWTPDNIAKDPQGYLDFCEEKTKDAMTKLKASEIAIAQNKASFESKREDAKTTLQSGNKALEELKAAYTKADADNSWPLKRLDRSFDKEQAKKQIVPLDRETKSKTQQMQSYDQGIKQLDIQATKVQDARDKANEQLTAIQTSREQLKVKAVTDDLKDQLVAMKGVLQTSVIGVADEKSTVSIEEIGTKTESTVSDDEFNKIMGGHK